MPREQTLNDPLSGAEIKEIAVRKFAEALNRDSTLVDDLAYAGFRLEFEGRIRYLRSTTSSTMVWGKHQEGVIEDGGSAYSVNGKYETDSPNTAREEHDLPLPVMVQTPSGPKREKVRFKVPDGKAKK